MRKTALIVHSKHTKKYAYKLAKNYSYPIFFEVTRTPTEESFKYKSTRNIIIGIGGGSVIDTAKIVAYPKRCIAIPTTASGASVTPYATIWGKRKESWKALKPVLKMKYDIDIKLPHSIEMSTFFDALSHAMESLWSKNSTFISRYYSMKAIKYLNKYLENMSIYTLIKAGNFAGKAIAIAKTNIVHAISYPLTIKYGIPHGLACGLLLPYIMYYLPNTFYIDKIKKIFEFGSDYNCLDILRSYYPYKLINLKEINSEQIASLALEYPKIHNTIYKISKNKLIHTIEYIKKENQ